MRFLPTAVRRFAPALLSAVLRMSGAGVVLNEVMYHPPGDDDTLQYVELHNAGAVPADLAGWHFSKGIRFTFPRGTVLAPGGFVVVARDPVALARAQGGRLAAVGPFEGRLQHGGERLALSDAAGRVVEEVRYSDRSPWPLGPDGFGASLERICPSAPAAEPGSWGGSTLPERRVPAGSPGGSNSVWSPTPPPRVDAVRLGTVTPGEPVRIEVDASAPGGRPVSGRVVWDRVAADGSVSPEASVDLVAGDGNRLAATWRLPAAPCVVRYRVVVRDAAGVERWFPAREDPRPALPVAVWPSEGEATIPRWHLIQYGATDERGASLRHRPRGGADAPDPARGNALLVRVPPAGGPPEVFDPIRITPRQGGWKVRMLKDRPIDGLDTLNVIFEDRPRFVLAEHLSYELYRAAGVAAPASGHVRVSHNGRPLGYHLWVEQPNRAFLRRQGLADDGSLYKLLWYGDGLVGQHEAKTPAAAGHADLKDTVRRLQASDGAAQWDVIRAGFDVDNFAGYYAVGMCLQNWDGYFNNYFLHRDPAADGRWTILPWDHDKTWGDYDGASAAYDWYTMPLTFGMAGDRAPRVSGGGGILSLFGFGGGMQGPWGGPGWWRPGGWFSAPLLANPQFRRHFLDRLDTLTRTVFTEEAFGPVIESMALRLRPEVIHRARVRGLDEAAEAGRFDRHMESFRNQLRERGRFLREQIPAARGAQ